MFYIYIIKGLLILNFIFSINYYSQKYENNIGIILKMSV